MPNFRVRHNVEYCTVPFRNNVIAHMMCTIRPSDYNEYSILHGVVKGPVAICLKISLNTLALNLIPHSVLRCTNDECIYKYKLT